MSYLYRCTKQYATGPFKGQRCYQRHHLPRKVEAYIRKPRCKGCGNYITYMDKWQRNKNRETTCHCGGPEWPHRKGSIVWCRYHQTGPTEEDYLNQR